MLIFGTGYVHAGYTEEALLFRVKESSGIVKRHFNSVVAENCMKCQTIHPEEDRYDFSQADEFVKFGEDNGLTLDEIKE